MDIFAACEQETLLQTHGMPKVHTNIQQKRKANFESEHKEQSLFGSNV